MTEMVLETKGLFVLILITFFSLFYKFMRCKRHISFGVTTLFSVLLCISFAFTASLAENSVLLLIKYLLPILLGFVCINIVRSSSMLESCTKTITFVCSIFSSAIFLMYLTIILFGYNQIMPIAKSHVFSYFVSAITDKTFAVPFIAICIPIIFSRLIATRHSLHLFTLIVFLLYSSVFCSYTEIIILAISCVIVLCFYNIKSIFLLFITPLVAYFATIPGAYLSNLIRIPLQKNTNIISLESFLNQFKASVLFGNGFLVDTTNTTGIQTLILSCGVIGTVLLFIILLRTVIKNILFSIKFNVAKTNLKYVLSGLCTSSIIYILLAFVNPVFTDLRCICIYSVVISLTSNVKRCIESDFIDPYLIRQQN